MLIAFLVECSYFHFDFPLFPGEVLKLAKRVEDANVNRGTVRKGKG